MNTILKWALVVILPLAGIAAGILTYPGTASADVAHRSHGSATGRTCAAFARWDRHRTAANLDAMLTASERAPWVFVGSDAAVVYVDVREGPAGQADLADDVANFRADCHR